MEKRVLNNYKILLTGGGSGGHVSILKAMIQYMQKIGFDTQHKLLLVGGRLGMISDPGPSLEARIFPDFGVPFRLIRGGKLHRALKPKTFTLLWGFVPGLLDAYSVMRDFGPDIIFATGGYVTLPVIIVGRLMGKKIIIHEQTLTAGLTNRIGGRFAHKVLLTFQQAQRYFPASKCELTGNIIRQEVLSTTSQDLEIKQLVEYAHKHNKKVLYVTGGSQGAHRINVFVQSNLAALAEQYVIVWQTGGNKYHNDYPKAIETIKSMGLEQRILVREYIKDEIGYILHHADLVLSRPGANTLYELAALNKKAILVPLWVTSQNDQLTNAKWYQDNFMGRVIDEQSLDIKNFEQAAGELYDINSTPKINIATKGVEDRIWQIFADSIN